MGCGIECTNDITKLIEEKSETSDIILNFRCQMEREEIEKLIGDENKVVPAI